MIRTPCYRTNLIHEAETLASGLVDLTERERAAYRAAVLSDPYARPTFERVHRRAQAARDAAFEALIGHCDELCREGLADFAMNLQRNAVRRCEVAIDVAAFELLEAYRQSPDRRKESFGGQAALQAEAVARLAAVPEEAAGARLPGLSEPDPAWAPDGSRDVFRDAARGAEGGARCII